MNPNTYGILEANALPLLPLLFQNIHLRILSGLNVCVPLESVTEILALRDRYFMPFCLSEKKAGHATGTRYAKMILDSLASSTVVNICHLSLSVCPFVTAAEKDLAICGCSHNQDCASLKPFSTNSWWWNEWQRKNAALGDLEGVFLLLFHLFLITLSRCHLSGFTQEVEAIPQEAPTFFRLPFCQSHSIPSCLKETGILFPTRRIILMFLKRT